MKHQGDLHNLYYEKDNVLYSSLDLFTYVPAYNTISNRRSSVTLKEKMLVGE